MKNEFKFNQTTDFGYQQIPIDQKTAKVGEVFHSVASKYDLMNDLMSFGMHRLWKRIFVNMAAVRPGQSVLDLASGTGDIAKRLAAALQQQGELIVTDINASMLTLGRECLINDGFVANISYVQANAETLPLASDYFDCITIAFGLRNVTDKSAALAEMVRVLRPGGQALILEFSKPLVKILKPFYDAYSFNVLPKLGEWIVNDADSYRYLAESIRMHPDQQTLQTMMEVAGFEGCHYINLNGGIVAIHRGYKY